MASAIKRLLGRTLLAAADRWPSSKPWLRAWGRRTNKAWFTGRVVRAQSRDGVQLHLASIGENYLSFELFWRGLDYYEPLTTWLTAEVAADAAHFLDVGANIGFHSLMLAARRPSIAIMAFEPNPKLHPLLAANVRVNGFRQIKCEAAALSATTGSAPLFISESDMSASLESGFEHQHTSLARVPTTTLDAYVARQSWRGPLLIKVDIEGHEAAFFAGARDTLDELHPDIIAEAAEPYDAETLATLTACGYRCYSISEWGLLAVAAPAPFVREPFVFLNNLLTTRPAAQLADLSDRLFAHASRIDFNATSKKADPHVLEKLRTRRTINIPSELATAGD